MVDLAWYINRLRAMSAAEVCWRLSQKRWERTERHAFAQKNKQITDKVFYMGKEDLTFHTEKLPLDLLCSVFGDRQGDICLLGGYSYEKYRKDWHAGFQTANIWPLTFSYDLKYKQRDEIGDARTNWELNRHFQFALMARAYMEEGDGAVLRELAELFFDWNEQNPFLTGISWTSVMEVAIRDINWMMTLAFLHRAAGDTDEDSAGADEACLDELCRRLQTGIINMTSYLAIHYSRYSSANNHVIVEAAAMGMAGLLTDYTEWIDTAVYILNYEIPRQNYPDGVNRELSLHYQSFFMEAVGVLSLTMKKCGRQIPSEWRRILKKMSRYLADCQGQYGETVVFGDDDAGKILDLCGGEWNHYKYVLRLMGELLPEIPEYHGADSVCYREGGVTLFKSRDGRALIGIDHGALGFGSIAAHGHADALSFQMYLEGEPVFADPGTYIYHIDLENRNAFRRTQNHNTVTIDGKDQSQMLGAFLWGKRAETKLLQHNLPIGNSCNSAKDVREQRESSDGTESLYVEAEHDGYAPVIHRRRFEFDGVGCLRIFDRILSDEKDVPYQLNFLLGEGCVIMEAAMGIYEIRTKKNMDVHMKVEAPSVHSEIAEDKISPVYGMWETTKAIRITGKTQQSEIITTIRWEEDDIKDEGIDDRSGTRCAGRCVQRSEQLL